jgi:hypothetical protein
MCYCVASVMKNLHLKVYKLSIIQHLELLLLLLLLLHLMQQLVPN